MNPNILRDVSQYYAERLERHGATPKGVDWNGEESQFLRFRQLLRALRTRDPFSVLDYGCGYGGFYEFLNKQFPHVRYTGFDISREMIETASQLHPLNENCRWISNESDLQSVDYVLGSGIFNVKLGYTDEEWKTYTLNVLNSFHHLSVKGFAFNMLSLFSDPHLRRNDLYYADPGYYFDYCMRNYSRFVTLYHDYPLFEFTIAVRKDEE